MSLETAQWKPYPMFCPNCREKLVGFKDKTGLIKMRCGACRVAIVRKQMGRRHDRFDMYAPDDCASD